MLEDVHLRAQHGMCTNNTVDELVVSLKLLWVEDIVRTVSVLSHLLREARRRPLAVSVQGASGGSWICPLDCLPPQTRSARSAAPNDRSGAALALSWHSQGSMEHRPPSTAAGSSGSKSSRPASVVPSTTRWKGGGSSFRQPPAYSVSPPRLDHPLPARCAPTECTGMGAKLGGGVSELAGSWSPNTSPCSPPPKSPISPPLTMQVSPPRVVKPWQPPLILREAENRTAEVMERQRPSSSSAFVNQVLSSRTQNAKLLEQASLPTRMPAGSVVGGSRLRARVGHLDH